MIYYKKLDFYLCILQYQVSNNINFTIVLQYLKLYFNLINNNILTYSKIFFFSLLQIFKCILQRSKVVIIKLKESWYAHRGNEKFPDRKLVFDNKVYHIIFLGLALHFRILRLKIIYRGYMSISIKRFMSQYNAYHPC